MGEYSEIVYLSLRRPDEGYEEVHDQIMVDDYLSDPRGWDVCHAPEITAEISRLRAELGEAVGLLWRSRDKVAMYRAVASCTPSSSEAIDEGNNHPLVIDIDAFLSRHAEGVGDA